MPRETDDCTEKAAKTSSLICQTFSPFCCYDLRI